MKCQSSISPITAVSFYGQNSGPLLLVAEGIYLKVFNVTTTQLTARCKVFKEQTIHGIAVNENEDASGNLRVVIWGGPSILVLYECDLSAVVEGRIFDISSREFCASDWILSIILSSKDFLFLTAHNSLSRANFMSRRKEFSLEALDSPSRSILYSAHMIWESSTSVMVAAGTVFGEIIVWQYHLKEAAKATVLFTFTGHEGSIFGVHISPIFHDTNGKTNRLLSSCSDDRTIRLWDVSPEAIKEKSGPKFVGQRLHEIESNGNISESSITQPHSRCLAVGWGHASRIWRVHTHVFGQENIKKLGLLSFGEDATCQLWSIDFQTASNNPQSETAEDVPKPSSISQSRVLLLSHRKVFAYHTGKHIWGADIFPLHNSFLVATGGADGKVTCFEISPAIMEPERTPNESHSQHVTWTLEQIFVTLPAYQSQLSTDHPINLKAQANLTNGKQEISQKQKKSKQPPKDDFNRYTFITERTILLTSTAGRILIGNQQQHNELTWQELQLPGESSDLKGYSVIKSIPELELTVFAAANGNIYRYRNGHCVDQIGSVKGKVSALFLTRNLNDRQSLHLLVTLLGSSEASLFFWHEDGNLGTVQSTYVFLPPKSIVTVAAEIRSLFYLGFRSGAIGVLDPKERQNVTFTYRPSAGEGADAVTSIIEIPTRGQESSICYVLAASRNGTYKILSTTTENSSDGLGSDTYMVPRHHSSPPLGSIEDACFEGFTLNLFGFRGKQFVVWNETQKCEVMAVECGGVHGSYAYSYNKLGGRTLIYTKASELNLHYQRTGSHKIVKDGGHGREIKACAISSGYKYIATAAEDTLIRIWIYQDGISAKDPLNHKFECLSIVEKHTTGIQHLQWHGSSYLFSSGGVEEFYIWAVQEIPGFGLGIICEATLLDRSTETDLRIMSFDIKEFPETDTRPETVPIEKTFLISLAYSDSTIKCYLYSKPNGFHRIAEGKYAASCLTQIIYLPYPPIDPYNTETFDSNLILCCDIFLLTAGTDGHLTTWKFTLSDLDIQNLFSHPAITSKRPVPISRIKSHKVHQNAIKSLDLISLSAVTYVVATGGDDNALAITYFGFYIDNPKTTILKSAHSAAVTALKFTGKEEVKLKWPDELPQTREAELGLVSSSSDQRVKAWDISVLDGGYDAVVDMKVVGDEFTAVADVGDMAVLRKVAVGSDGPESCRKVLVVGNGMDVWTI